MPTPSVSSSRTASLLRRAAEPREGRTTTLQSLLALDLLSQTLAFAFNRLGRRFVAEVGRELPLQADDLGVAVSQLLLHAVQFGLYIEQPLGGQEQFDSPGDRGDRPRGQVTWRPFRRVEHVDGLEPRARQRSQQLGIGPPERRQ